MSSENEPLLATNNNNNNQTEDDTQPERSRAHKYLNTTKILLFMCVLLVSVVVVIYMIHVQTSSVPNVNWIQMEQSHSQSQQQSVPISWTEKDDCSDDYTFTLTIALKQQNTDQLLEHITAVSDPDSIEFHKYWTAEQVQSFFQSSDDTLDSVMEWLLQNTEITHERITHNKYGNVIKVSLNCAIANQLLHTKYLIYENDKGATHLHVQNGIYHIPDSILEHIDFISPTLRFPLQHHTTKVELLNSEQLTQMKAAFEGEEEDIVYNTPTRLYGLYTMAQTVSEIIGNVNYLDTSQVRQGILSAIEQYYSDDDLKGFWNTFRIWPQSQMKRIPDSQPQGYGDEAELDTQYITTTGNGIWTYVYYMSDESDPFISLSEAILSTEIRPVVVSMSYGANEYQVGKQYALRVNEEFGKLALVGVTLLASSGDGGAIGDSTDCLNGSTYVPTFPASSPYVTAVGGTEGGTVPQNEQSCTDEITWVDSGGGFSEFFATPKWQKKAIKSYLKRSQSFAFAPDTWQYNQDGRGYPDISAQAVNFVINVEGGYYAVSGTSASSPTVAGMISMINYARSNLGKASLGFLNPVLYGFLDNGNGNVYFNDVTEGYNVGCSEDDSVGFYACEGWDPITGVGTPKFASLYAELLNVE